MNDNNYNDLIQVLSGNRDIKVGINYSDLALLVVGFFIAVLAANYIANKI